MNATIAVFICRQDAMLLSSFAAKLLDPISILLDLHYLQASGFFKWCGHSPELLTSQQMV
jgi:hypothetical protein